MGRKPFFEKHPEALARLAEKVAVGEDGQKRLTDTWEVVAAYVGCSVSTVLKEVERQGIVSQVEIDTSFRWDDMVRAKLSEKVSVGEDGQKRLTDTLQAVAVYVGCVINTLQREMDRQGIVARGREGFRRKAQAGTALATMEQGVAVQPEMVPEFTDERTK